MTVVGVAPPSFHGTDHLVEPDGFIPITTVEALDPGAAGLLERRESGSTAVIGRVKTQVRLSTIQAALTAFSRQLQASYPGLGEDFQLHAFSQARARPTLEAANFAPTAELVFGGLALLVLLTGCVNAANLGLAHGSTRQSELVVRQALGASRGRVVRQLLTQNALLAMFALAMASGATYLAIEWVAGIRFASDVPLDLGLRLDIRVFVMAAAVALLAGTLAGLGPAVVASRYNLQAGVREAGRGGGGRQAELIRSGLVVAQVGTSLVALICAGLLALSARRASRMDLGFEPNGVLALGLDGAQAQLDGPGMAEVVRRVSREIARIPGVAEVASADGVPTSGFSNVELYDVLPDGAVAATAKTDAVSLLSSAVSPAFFATVRMPILDGRAFEESDSLARPRVAIINQRAGELLWPGRSPIGRLVRLGSDTARAEIVGVAKDSKYLLIGESPRPYLYVPLAQRPSAMTFLFVRTRHDPGAIIPEVRAAVAVGDRRLTPFEMHSFNETLRNGLNGLLPMRVAAAFASAVGLLAAILAVLGLYGVMSYSVLQRTREIGLRTALGADRRSILLSVLNRGGRLLAIGLAIGLAAAIALTRQLAAMLVAVSATEVNVFIAAAVGLSAVALFSAAIPAWRAARIDPVVALKADG